MRKFSILLLAGLQLLLGSCYQDLSTEATLLLPDIVVTGLEPSLDVVYGQELSVSVKAYMGAKTTPDFEYLWEIDLHANDPDDRVELGTEPTLTFKVANTPSSTPYMLSVKVRDPETGLCGVRSSYVHVSSSLGEGLLVAYSRPDGSSEFDIVASPAVTYGYTGEPRITRALFSLANNNQPFPEKVTALLQTNDTQNAVYDSRRILVGSEHHITAINPLTFQTQEKDGQLFSSTTISEFGPITALFNCGGYTSYMYVGESGYGHVCSIDNVYAKLPTPSDKTVRFLPTNYGYGALDQGRFVLFNNGDAFYEIMAYQIMSGLKKVDADMLDFSLDGAESLMGGCLRGARPAFLIKDKTGALHITVMELSSTSAPDTFISIPFEGENIDQAVSIAFCDNGDLFYYATADALYATIISGNTSLVRKLSWKPDNEGERITSIQQYRQAWYGTGQIYPSDYGYTLPNHRAALIITTYNDSTGEGKFYLRGFNVSTGMFTFSGDYGSFGGFGKITAIAPTLR